MTPRISAALLLLGGLTLYAASERAPTPARSHLIQAIWKQPILPKVVPIVAENLECPVDAPMQVLRCDWLILDMGGGFDHSGYLFRTAMRPQDRLVILLQGHTDVLDEFGLGDLLRELVGRGFDVLLMGMPGRAGNGGHPDHNTYAALETPELNPLRYFLEPAVAAINLLDSQYADITAIGLSGGGWTTTALAAIDPRIRISIPIAGTLPSYMRQHNSLGDWEQWRIDQITPYPVQYMLGSDSPGRRQVQVLNRDDSCCFSQSGITGAYGTSFNLTVSNWLTPQLTAAHQGSFAFREDISHASHKISRWAIDNVILPELDEPSVVDITLNEGRGGHTLGGPIGVDNVSAQPWVWTRWTSAVTGAHQAIEKDYLAAPNQPSGWLTSRWSFRLAPGTYTVSASWIPHSNRASNARYRVYDGTALIGEILRDQRGLVSLHWSTLGEFYVASGELHVELSNEGADGSVIADAVRINN